jgi:hypothetical protein
MLHMPKPIEMGGMSGGVVVEMDNSIGTDQRRIGRLGRQSTGPNGGLPLCQRESGLGGGRW